MTTELRDMQFELLPSEDFGGEGYAFGIGLDVSINDGGFNAGDTQWSIQDSVNSTRGFTQFGRDVKTADQWSWACHADQEDDVDALAATGAMSAAWSGPLEGWEPGVVTTLRYRLGGRVRRIYGRPRRFNAALSNLMISGNIPINADFKRVDALYYDDELQSSGQITWAADGAGGFVLPTTLPIQTIPDGTSQGSILVGGDAATPAIMEINGPITRPTLAVGGWTATIDDTLSASDQVIIDARPWHMSITKNGQPIPGRLGRRQRMSAMVLRPGEHQVTLRGSGSGGGATGAVSWRNAWTSL